MRTTAAHRRSFDKSPRVVAGDAVRRVRDDPESPGWFWGVDPSGVEGFFPRSWFEFDAGCINAKAIRDYNAEEITIDAGVAVACVARESGWLLVRTADGLQGWIPECCVE